MHALKFVRQTAISLLLAAQVGLALAVAAAFSPELLNDPLSEPRFEPIGVGSIPRGVVASAAQDGAGFLWLATGDGLVRYDGYRFRPQELDSADPARRNLGWIRALLPSRDGRLWIGTESAGLAVYDPKTDRVTLATPAAAQPPAPTILALAEGHDGSVWSGSLGGGLEHLDLQRGRRTHYRHGDSPGSLPDDRVVALLVDRQGSLWVGSWQGLSVRRRGSDRFDPVDQAALPPGSRVQALLQASDGLIWAGTQHGTLVRLDPDSGRAERLDAGRTAAESGEVNRLLEAPAGQVWVGRTQGLSLFRLDGRLLQRLRHDPRRPDGLAANHVTSLVQDRAGWIWVGGFGLGLQRHNPANQALRVRAPDLDSRSAFADGDTRSLLALDDGQLWAATQSSGVAVMDASLRVVGALPDPPVAALPNPGPGRPTPLGPLTLAPAPLLAQAMARAADGSIWLGVDQVLHRYSPDRRWLQAVALPGGPARRLLASADGSLWIATQDGLFRLKAGASGCERLRLPDGQPFAGEVHALALAPDGAVWVGAAAGLFRVAAGSTHPQPVGSPAGGGLGNPTVIGLLFDRQQTLWVDTAVAGLHRLAGWDGPLARFERISQRHGVLNRPFGVNLLQDSRGRIWTHMYVYDPATDRLDQLTEADGVRYGTGWFHAYAALSDGRFVFGGSKGLLVVRPDAFDVSSFAPPLVVSELRVNGQRQPTGPAGTPLTLTPQHRSFSVQFAALDYSDPGRLRYSYRLQGFDPDWITTGAESRDAAYSNLDPGRYLLQVRATNHSGRWSTHELALPLQVLPAWWQREEFRWAVLLALAALVMALVQWRTRQLRHGQQALQAKVIERTAELEAMARALRLESAALQESSVTDPLTGLRNRRFFSQHIEADVALALRRHGGPQRHSGAAPTDADLVFFLVDIDQFKQVNDTHGHAAGDAVLMQMRGRLQQVFRDTDYLVRWGGEEFLIVARESNRRHAAELAERARAAVADHAFTLPDGVVKHKTCSIGFAAFPLAPAVAQPADWALALNCADAALYAVKQHGRNGWLGLVDVHAASADELKELLRQPAARWASCGSMVLARSAGLSTQDRAAGSPA